MHFIGCAFRAPSQTLRSVPEREVKKTISLGGFLGVCPSGASPDPRVGPCVCVGGIYCTPIIKILDISACSENVKNFPKPSIIFLLKHCRI